MQANELPIRVLLQPDLEIPEDCTPLATEQREAQRFKRAMIGTLTHGEGIYEVACRSVTHQGVRVELEERVEIHEGDVVTLRLLQAGRTYCGTCTVKWTTQEDQKMIVGLTLSDTDNE
ncbi:MAG: PilZ domain-containing protein [Planctomycetota bacterium]|jgi:hypothetical protein